MRSGDPLLSGIFGNEIDVAVGDLDDGIAFDFKRRERLELEFGTASKSVCSGQVVGRQIHPLWGLVNDLLLHVE